MEERTMQKKNAGIARSFALKGLLFLAALTLSTGIFACKTTPVNIPMVKVEGGICILNGKAVTLSGFWISPYEVTQEEFVSVMTGNKNGIEANPSYFQGDTKPPAEGEVQERRPVENVRWYDAIVYCNLLSIKEGLTPCYAIKSFTDPADWGTYINRC